MQDQLNRFAGGNLQRRADDVVLARRVLVVETEGIAGGIVDELEIGVAELAVGPRVTEAPGELFAEHRSEEHTSELQSRQYIVCRLLLENTHHRTEGSRITIRHRACTVSFFTRHDR